MLNSKLKLVGFLLSSFFLLFIPSFTEPVQAAVNAKPQLSWQRSSETSSKVVKETFVGSKVNEALQLPLDPSQIVFDNGQSTALVNKDAVGTGIEWSSWRQYSAPDPYNSFTCGTILELRHFQAKFNLDKVTNIQKIKLQSPYYTPGVFPINDNAYIYLNGNFIARFGTSYGALNLGLNGTASYANETDGWIANVGDLGSNAVGHLLTGQNTLDIVTGETCRWGGMGKIELILELSPKTPLILIPGIGGSELKVLEETIWSQDNGPGGTYNHTYAAGEKVWVNEGEAANPGNDDYFDVLRMKADGVTSEANIGLTGSIYAGAYQGAIDFFTANGYTLNEDLFVFPYDWRKDIALTASSLDTRISQIKSQTGSAKVDIIAHSMGGLVARNYIADATRAQNVRKLFTLGTPHLGAVEFLKFLRYGGCFTKPELQEIPLCIGLEGLEVKDVIQNMIAGFQLAPSQVYFNFYSDEDNNHPYPYRTENGSLNYLQIKNLLTIYGHNTYLFTPTENFHTLDNSLANTNNVDVTIIAGSGQPTLGQIIELVLASLNGNIINFKDKRDINGDGTVPLLSASLTDPHKNLFLNGTARVYYTNQEHGRLVTDGSALQLIKNILEGNTDLPDGVSETPFKLAGHGLSVHSPVNIHVYDASGNHTGPTSDGFETNIPGLSYDTLDDAKFIYLSGEGIYNIKFEATDNGSFDFKIRKFENDENTETVLYKEIPLTNNTKAKTIFDTSTDQPPVIEVDQDGDGNTDFNVENFSILEGNANYDYTPPTISFGVNLKTIWPPNGKMVDVNVTGNINDENPYLTKIIVDDEYDSVEPSVTFGDQTSLNQIIQLEASRREKDQDGRKYILKILATDLAGNTSLATTEIIVPHDQGKEE